MFTGIIQATAKIVKFENGRLWIDLPFKKLTLGESISIDGVCLTIAAHKGTLGVFDVGPETLRVTTLSTFRRGRAVNLERALRYGESLSGHYVSGHVEAVGVVRKIERAGSNHWCAIAIPKKLMRWVLLKGSVAVDGISLTVASRAAGHARLMIVPHTWFETTLSQKKVGDKVNLETDVLAKYAAQLHKPRSVKR